jgi:hypothetical protein
MYCPLLLAAAGRCACGCGCTRRGGGPRWCGAKPLGRDLDILRAWLCRLPLGASRYDCVRLCLKIAAYFFFKKSTFPAGLGEATENH